MTRATRLVLVMAVLLHAAGAAAQSSRPDETSPRITMLEAWLSAVGRHRPGTFDLGVGLVSGLNQEQLRLIWIDVRTIVSLVRVPDVSVFKRALDQNPKLVEARIRLGRVLGLRGHHDEAIEQLKQGLSEALRNDAEARRSYERAAAIEPLAQSPLFGLSRLADQAGDGAAARQAVARVLKLPPNEYERTDPWWVYEAAQSRDVDLLLADIRRGF